MQHNKLITMITGIALITGIGCADLSVIEPGRNTAYIHTDGNRSGVAFAVAPDLWVTAGHVADESDHAYLHLEDEILEIEKVYERLDLDITFFRVAYLVERPVSLCRRVYWGQPVTHVRIDSAGKMHDVDGVTVRLHDDQSDNGPWDGKLVKTDGDTTPGWSGGPVIGYDIRREQTCIVGMTVGGDVEYGVSWMIPVEALREKIKEAGL